MSLLIRGRAAENEVTSADKRALVLVKLCPKFESYAHSSAIWFLNEGERFEVGYERRIELPNRKLVVNFHYPSDYNDTIVESEEEVGSFVLKSIEMCMVDNVRSCLVL